MRSSFQMKCTLRWDVPPGSDIWWPRAEWPHIFRWSVPSDEMYTALLHQVSLTPSPASTEPSGTDHYYIRSVWSPSPPSIEPSGTEPYYTRWVWHVAECRCTHLLIKPSGTEPYYTRWVWHVAECRHTQVRCTPLLTKPSGTEPYYTRSNEFNISDEMYPPAHQRQCSRALWNQVSLTCGRMQTYPGQMYLQPLLIKSSVTEHYYTRCVWHGRMQTYPGQMYLQPLLIKSSVTEHYYTRCVWHGRMQTYPGQMYPH